MNYLGDWITSNLSNINKAGIVDVPIEQDIPRLVQGAMTCLAARQRDPLKGNSDVVGLKFISF